jgi:magnesium chelatase subunit ChlD-like protein
MIILLTDGAGNVSIGERPPQEEAHGIATMIREADIKTVTINMEHVAFDRGLATQLADKLGGPCYTLGQLRAEILYQTVKQEIDQR